MVPVDAPAADDAQMDVDIDPTLQAQAGPSSGPKMKSNLRLFPPPLFSRQGIPINYKFSDLLLQAAPIIDLEPPWYNSFKANPASVAVTTVDEKTGEEKTRLINRMRWKGLSPVSISYHDEGVRRAYSIIWSTS